MNEISKVSGFSRLLAGLWFAVAGCIPVSFVFLSGLVAADNINSKVILFGILPVLIAGICGFRLGSSILDANLVKNSKQAIMQGIKVALFSYAFFIPLFSLGTAFYFSIYEASPNRTFVDDFMGGLLGSLFAGFIGLILVGWLIVLISAIAGWILFKLRLVFE